MSILYQFIWSYQIITLFRPRPIYFVIVQLWGPFDFVNYKCPHLTYQSLVWLMFGVWYAISMSMCISSIYLRVWHLSWAAIKFIRQISNCFFIHNCFDGGDRQIDSNSPLNIVHCGNDRYKYVFSIAQKCLWETGDRITWIIDYSKLICNYFIIFRHLTWSSMRCTKSIPNC